MQRAQAVRAKRSSASRDALPEEAFMRLRGSLFFGPAFLVTRNKLTFRDTLQALRAAASPGALRMQRHCFSLCHWPLIAGS